MPRVDKKKGLPLTSRLYLLLPVVLAGCASGQLDTKGYWEPRNALYWDEPRVSGLELFYEDGSMRRIDPQVVDTLVATHERVTKASGKRWVRLALADVRSGGEPAFQAFASRDASGPVVTVSLGMLDGIGNDPDALAAVLAHELAHLSLGHTDGQVKAREEALQKSQQVGAGLTTGSAAVAALIYRAGAMIYYRSLSRDEERAADAQGLQWSVKAGFDPCGMVRMLAAANLLGAASLPFISTHPDSEERRALASRFSREAGRADCAEAGAAGGARTTQAATPPPAADRAAPDAQAAAAAKSYDAGVAAAKAGDFAGALREMRSLAGAGYAPAQAMLAYWYLTAYAGLPKDEVEAARLMRLAADQGHAWAQANLGRMYLRGMGGLKQDAGEAVRLFRLSALQGNRSGEFHLGFAYLRGTGGLKQDVLEGARYLSRAADKGDLYAAVELGWIYYYGTEGIPKDAVEAVSLFRLSAEQGHAYGQASLARMYFIGAGDLPRDQAEALRLNRLAAEQGNATAQNNLGAMRENGQGGQPADLEEAVRWYRLAAAQGNAGAIRNLDRLGRK